MNNVCHPLCVDPATCLLRLTEEHISVLSVDSAVHLPKLNLIDHFHILFHLLNIRLLYANQTNGCFLGVVSVPGM